MNNSGSLNPLMIPLILAVLIVLGTSVSTVLFYVKFTEQRDANEPIIAAAVSDAKETQKEQLESEFTEREKIPTKQYTSPQQHGSVKLSYPKTWSSYVDTSQSGGMNFYAHPNFVPAKDVNYALRMSIVNRPFAQEIKSYDSQVKNGDLKAAAVRASGVTGTKLDGFLQREQEGIMVVFPLRDKTLRIWTESKEFSGDFNDIVLAALSFAP